MSPGNRDELWNSSWETYYSSYFYEIYISKAVSRWKLFDLLTKIIVAITATGSAVAGWSLWAEGGYKDIWAILAGTAALLSIIHAVTQVQSILETLTELRSSFSSLRVALESYRQQLSIFPEFDVTEKNNEFLKNREKYEQLIAKFSGDILLTQKLAEKAQDELNIKLGVN
jgi:hypothetical protein